MSSRWVPVFQGSLSEVLVLQSNCEASGIPTFVPSLNLPYLDVTNPGGSHFLQLLVPEDRLEDGRSLVPDSKRGGIPTVEPAEAELTQIARRVQVCTVLLITAPLAIFFYLEYRKRARAAAEPPPGHATTRLCFFFSVALSVLVPLWYLLQVLAPGS
jgi:hypothetical protein